MLTAMAGAAKGKVAKKLNVLPIWSLSQHFTSCCKALFVTEHSSGFASQI